MDPLILAAGTVVGIGMCLHRRARRAQAKLTRELEIERYAATHDSLTGLPNRRGLYDIGAKLIANPARPNLVGVLFDLDNFKAVNDRLGHAAGDQVLVMVARRFASYAGNDLIARLGGDEFAGLLTTPSTHRTCLRPAADQLVRVLAAPIYVNGQQRTSTVSIGLAPVWRGATLPEVLGRADSAMYRAKSSGSGTACFDPV
ncbi:MAG TPA: GGDEF domain-containing protein, partial [Gemmataceae bacterium]|nr:GGDEF domain-containing protein [Gemmataceae bacterium]